VTEDAYHNARTDEVNRVRALGRQEQEVRRLADERWRRRLSALGPGTQVPDPTGFAPCCTVDMAPYPDVIHPALEVEDAA
jgi:hypothetical protein